MEGSKDNHSRESLKRKMPGSTVLLLDIPDLEEFVKSGQWVSSASLLDMDGFRWIFQARAHSKLNGEEGHFLGVRLFCEEAAEEVFRSLAFVRFNVVDPFDGISLHSEKLCSSEKDDPLDIRGKNRYCGISKFCSLDGDAVKWFCLDGKALHLEVEFAEFDEYEDYQEEYREATYSYSSSVRDWTLGLILLLIAFLVAAFADLPLTRPVIAAIKKWLSFE